MAMLIAWLKTTFPLNYHSLTVVTTEFLRGIVRGWVVNKRMQREEIREVWHMQHTLNCHSSSRVCMLWS